MEKEAHKKRQTTPVKYGGGVAIQHPRGTPTLWSSAPRAPKEGAEQMISQSMCCGPRILEDKT